MTMKAVMYDKKGSPGRLKYCDVDNPVPGDDEVLIKIVAVSPNAADYRSMKMGLIPKNKIFGADVAGKVESTGKNIRQFRTGDEVLGDLASFGFGGFAEYAVAPEKALVSKPPNLSFEEAAALPMAALTALQALRNKGGVQKGNKVLIVGSGGGVGTYAIQLAKYFGAEVTAVCGTKNVEQSRSLGADRVIDYLKENFAEDKNVYDILLAVNGNYSLSAYIHCLVPGGRCVMVGGSLNQIFRFFAFGWILSLGSKKIEILAAKPVRDDLELIARLAEEGIIKPVIDRRYPLEKVPEAMRYLAEGHASGKVVINVQS
jgi:NADPH:quinone reductase-like Zn-dependent oxidoreductase